MRRPSFIQESPRIGAVEVGSSYRFRSGDVELIYKVSKITDKRVYFDYSSITSNYRKVRIADGKYSGEDVGTLTIRHVGYLDKSLFVKEASRNTFLNMQGVKQVKMEFEENRKNA